MTLDKRIEPQRTNEEISNLETKGYVGMFEREHAGRIEWGKCKERKKRKKKKNI